MADVQYWKTLEEATLGNHLSRVKSLVEEDSSRMKRSLEFIAHLAAQKGHIAIFEYAVKKEPSILVTKYEEDQTVAHIAAMSGHRDVLTFIAQEKPSALALVNAWRKTALYLALKKDTIKNVRTLRFFVEEKDVPLTNLKDLAYIAAAKGKLSLLKYIVDQDSSVLDKKHDFDQNLAHIAAINGHPKVIRYLAERAPYLVTEKGSLGNNILHMMAQHNSKDLKTFKFLEERGIPLTQMNLYDKDAAYFAAETGNVNAFRYIVEQNPSVLETKYSGGRTIAHIAVNRGQWKIVRYIAEKRPDLLALTDHRGNTILHTAANRNNVNKETLKFLLEEAGTAIPLNATNVNGFTVAEIAARHRNLEFIQYLGESMPSLLVSEKMMKDVTLLEYALYSNLRTLKLLIKNCGPILECRGSTKLIEENDRFHMVPYLMASNPPARLASRAVHEAIDLHFPTVVFKYLVDERKIDVNILNERAEPPIFTAVRKRRRSIIEYLAAEKNANLTVVNADGENILFVAAKADDLQTMKYVLENRTAEIDLEWRNKLGDRVIHAAVHRVLDRFTELNVIEYLVEQKHVNVNARGDEGKTCLHHAALRPNIKVCTYLRQQGADPEVRDVLGRTYWDVALFNRSGRYRRSAARYLIPPSYCTSILHSPPRERIARKMGAANSVQTDGVNSSAYNQVHSIQLQNFLTIGKWILGRTKMSLNRDAPESYVSSPLTVVQGKINAAAMAAVNMIF